MPFAESLGRMMGILDLPTVPFGFLGTVVLGSGTARHFGTDRLFQLARRRASRRLRVCVDEMLSGFGFFVMCYFCCDRGDVFLGCFITGIQTKSWRCPQTNLVCVSMKKVKQTRNCHNVESKARDITFSINTRDRNRQNKVKDRTVTQSAKEKCSFIRT